MPDHPDSQISYFDAAEIAAQWHSVITWNDPGVTMYSVTSTGKVHSEEHRAALLDYIATKCMPTAVQLDASGDPDDAAQYDCGAESNVEALEMLAEWARTYIIESESTTSKENSK
jgi:hypothetical protein